MHPIADFQDRTSHTGSKSRETSSYEPAMTNVKNQKHLLAVEAQGSVPCIAPSLKRSKTTGTKLTEDVDQRQRRKTNDATADPYDNSQPVVDANQADSGNRLEQVVDILAFILQSLCESNHEEAEMVSRSSGFEDYFGIEQAHFCGIQPPKITLFDYLRRISTYSGASLPCYVVALIYIDRLMDRHKTWFVHIYNVHRLLITAIMVAAKFLDDEFFNNKHYARMGGVSLRELNKLEIQFLHLLTYDLSVTPQLYNLYLIEIQRQIDDIDEQRDPRQSVMCHMDGNDSEEDKDHGRQSRRSMDGVCPQTDTADMTTEIEDDCDSDYDDADDMPEAEVIPQEQHLEKQASHQTQRPHDQLRQQQQQQQQQLQSNTNEVGHVQMPAQLQSRLHPQHFAQYFHSERRRSASQLQEVHSLNDLAHAMTHGNEPAATVSKSV